MWSTLKTTGLMPPGDSKGARLCSTNKIAVLIEVYGCSDDIKKPTDSDMAEQSWLNQRNNVV
ncbi:hypothetical protein M514_19615 [Trichuris suis]|uniref:Uncharacterized protein n=1 Tax=Trichuris suis TaxID=68888 RepID=A0A085NF87_9BILA|nr:hypothetical protein M514_19615 [Trichuris suis]